MDIELTTFDPGTARADPKADASYSHFRAYDRMTKEPKGWLGCTDGAAKNYLRIYSDKDAASSVKFVDEGKLKYLARSTSPADRYLGLSEHSYAGWGLKGGWRNAIKFHPDGAISLDPYDDQGFKDRYLYLNNSGLYTNYCCWSDNAENSNILVFVRE